MDTDSLGMEADSSTEAYGLAIPLVVLESLEHRAGVGPN